MSTPTKIESYITKALQAPCLKTATEFSNKALKAYEAW